MDPVAIEPRPLPTPASGGASSSTAAHASAPSANAEHNVAIAHDSITPSTTQAATGGSRRQPTSRKVMKALGGLALFGAGAGVYRAGEAIREHAIEANLPHYVKYGNINVNSAITDEFEKAASVMREYPGTAKTLSFLLNAPPNFKGEPLSIDPGPNSEYQPTTNSIYWTGLQKLAVINPKNATDVAGLSPVGILSHEMKHAEHTLTDPVAGFVRMGIPHPQFDTHEEKLTILETNRDLANLPGEAQRFDHHNTGLPGVAQNVTDNTVDATFKPLDERLINMAKAVYSKESYEFAQGLSLLDSTTGTTLAIMQELKGNFGGSFNNTNIVKIRELMDEGKNVAVNYATANHNNTEPTALETELAKFSEKAESFAASLYVQSGDKQLSVYGPLEEIFSPNAQRDIGALSNAIKHNGDPGNATLTPLRQSRRMVGKAPAPAPSYSTNVAPLAKTAAEAVGAEPAP